MYAKAIAGDRNALAALYDAAGLRNPGVFGGSAVGFATAEGRAYASQRYAAALAILKTKDGGSGGAAITGATVGPPAKAEGLNWYIVGGVAVLAFLAFRFLKRG
jgi:hypothetical protein